MLGETNTKANLLPDNDSVEERIVEKIFEAVIDQRLPAGTKLSESNLCEVFSVSRMRIRRSLLLLANHEVVEIFSNRGAYIASPSKKQARDVFEARQTIEPNVAKLVVERATSKDILKLEKHLKLETAAHENGCRRESIRYSGAFHVLLAEIADNRVMLRTIKELITRSSLIIGIFGAPGVACCRDNDHAAILGAIKDGDQDKASALMSAHLHHLQHNIELDTETDTPIDLKAVFNT